MAQTIFDFESTSIYGERVSLSAYEGQLLLIVNTASYCGFTPQFRGLEYLYRRYKPLGFSILGFPCNQFAYQDPRDNKRISDFCIRNYGVSFPMFAKVKVNGSEADPLYRFLKSEAPGLLGIQAIPWNFTKFLVNREGQVIKRFGPTVFPSRIARHIDRLLEE